MQKGNGMKKRVQALVLVLTMTLGSFMDSGVSYDRSVKAASNKTTAKELSNPTISADESLVTWDCIWFGNYYQSDASGKEKEPIKWRILSVDGKDAFLFADGAVEMGSFCEKDEDEDKIPTDNLNWGISTIRSYLNGYAGTENILKTDYSKDNLLAGAFTDKEQNAIMTTTVTADKNPQKSSDQGADTKDKLYLLSAAEASNKEYGFINDAARRFYNTNAYVHAGGKGTTPVGVTAEIGYAWWTRTMGGEYSQQYIYAVASELYGNFHIDGCYAASPGFCIRPAMHLDLEKAAGMWSYAGTVNSDGSKEELNGTKPVVSAVPKESIAPNQSIAPSDSAKPIATAIPTPKITLGPTSAAEPTNHPIAEATSTPQSYTNGNTLPIMNITIDETKGAISDMNNDNDKKAKCYGNIYFTIPSSYQSEYGSLGIENGQALSMQIKGRGNASWHTDKKPYKIKLDEKADLFGMGSSKHWVLIANAYEFTYMKNKTLFDLAEKMGLKYSSQSIFVDVVMNGKYLGNYLLCEQIRVGKTRVNIDDLEEDKEMTGTDITGGYLVNLDSYTSMDAINYRTKIGKSYGFESPSFEDGLNASNQAQYDYITDYLQRLEDSVYAENFLNEKGEHFSELMDVDSFVNYFLLQFFSDNFDAFHNSTYMYKERDGKLYWGPVWDFDHSMSGEETTSTSVIDNMSRYMVKQLLANPEVAKRVNERYQELRSTLVALYANNGYIDQTATSIRTSVKNDMTALQPMYKKNYDFDDELEEWKEWMEARIQFMDTYLPTLIQKHYTVTFQADNGSKNQQIYVLQNATLGFVETPKKENAEFAGWYYTKDGQELECTSHTIVSRDITVTAKWKEKEDEKNDTECYVTLNPQSGKIKGMETLGEDSIIDMTIPAGTAIRMNMKAVRAGYAFKGWYTKATGGTKVSSTKEIKVTKDITYYAQWSKITVPQVKKVSCKNVKGKKAKISYGKVASVKGYEIVYSNNSKLKNAKKNTQTALTYTMEKLTKGKIYYVKVRAYKVDSTGKKIYGKYSKVKKVKIVK